MKTARAMTTLLLAAAFSIPAVGLSASPSIACVAVDIPGLGHTCRRSNGLLEIRSPSGEFLGLTHGLDAIESDSDHSSNRAAGDGSSTAGAALSQRPAACVDASDYHVELIYARAYDDVDDYARMAPWFRYEFETANWLLNYTAAETGLAGVDYKVLCSNGSLVVHTAVLPTSVASDSWTSVFRDVRAAGFTNSRVKYVVFYDQSINSYSGMADMSWDDRLAADNGALRGMIGLVTAMSYRIVMHELSHTMGAVQNSAPHSSGAAHCTDGSDVMCYGDGGPNSSQFTTSACPEMHAFDCNHDDYFHANPPAGNYLATRWNLASRYNKYLRFPDDPGPSPSPSASPTVTTSPAPTPTPSVSSTSTPAPTPTPSVSSTPTPAPTPTPSQSASPTPTQSPTPSADRTAPTLSISEPRAGVLYNGGCSGKRGKSPSSSRPAYSGGKGCVQAGVTDSGSGAQKLQVYFDGRLVWTVWSFPMSPLTFNLGRGKGTKIPLQLVATDKAGNKSSKTIYIDVV